MPSLARCCDWLGVLCLALGGLYLEHGHPFERDLRPQLADPAISYPYTPPDRMLVTVPRLLALSAGVPTGGIVLLAPFRSGAVVGTAALGLWLSLSGTFLFVNIVKLCVGRLRPDFLARCVPDAAGVCSGAARAIIEGRKSFPSGHAALSSAGLIFLAIALAAHLSSRPSRCGVVWRAAVVWAVWMVPLLVGLSRVADYWHHWSDVATGLAIGHAAAAGSWILFFRSPFGAMELRERAGGVGGERLYTAGERDQDEHPETLFSLVRQWSTASSTMAPV
jgi:diacylglycerol diphosphate phosphatase/phosphatidate phosphatase